MKNPVAVSLLFLSGSVFAGGWSDFSVPTQLDIERGSGFMIFGNFGNAGGCASINQLYVRSDHPQYKQIYAAALAAFMGKYRVRAYVNFCEPLSWYALPSTTFNVIDANSALTISD